MRHRLKYLSLPGRHRMFAAQRPWHPLLATGMFALLCLGSAGVGVALHGDKPADAPKTALVALDDRALPDERGSRSTQRQAPPAAKVPAPAVAAAPPVAAKPVAPPKPPAPPAPVAGLSQAQMNNAATIVSVGRQKGMPTQAKVVAIATAYQESKLLNLANTGVQESASYPHEGTGWDFDSVGLFQQRYTMGWGSVSQLMNPSYAAAKFYERLAMVNWGDMGVAGAAQAVQGSAFPDAYAAHETLARTVVQALGG